MKDWKFTFLMVMLFSVVGTLLFGCSSNYKPGDLTRSYCASADLEFRAGVRALLSANGITMPINPCLAIGVVDVLKQETLN